MPSKSGRDEGGGALSTGAAGSAPPTTAPDATPRQSFGYIDVVKRENKASAAGGNTNRVKVAVRCRPPFEEEGSVSAVLIPPSRPAGGLPSTMQLEVGDKRREFTFDVVFGPEATNTSVYDVVSGPVVDGVMKGVNGTVLAYGQTGSGKTHSLGILTRVTGESGIIPRALSHIFGYIAQANAANAAGTAVGLDKGTTYTVTISFLQLYLDTVQDLLTPTAGGGQGGSGRASMLGDASMLNTSSVSAVNSSFLLLPSHAGHGGVRQSSGGGGGGSSWGGLTTLAVREDPARGFYVEGASEYNVTTFADALTLLNYGLENRVLGATRMNATSSRSHTMLQVKVEAKQPVSLRTLLGEGAEGGASAGPHAQDAASGKPHGTITRRSQLVLCDLAGSERVRRTSSRGARLEEARAINASLHTLGQVISALALISQQASGGQGGAPRVHVPWRDSKLTRLLYGNLGGNANTYLLATMGPAPRNASETLSTLSFASRCMRVSANPVASLSHSQVDYAHLATRLQARLAGLEAGHAGELGALARRYEEALADAKAQLDVAQRQAVEAEAAAAAAAAVASVTPAGGALESVTVSMSDVWEGAAPTGSPPALKAAYTDLCRAYDASAAAILRNQARYTRAQHSWTAAIQRARIEEGAASGTRDEMAQHDPMTTGLEGGGGAAPSADGTRAPALSIPALDPSSFGPHLGAEYRSAAAAMQAVHSQHNSNSVGRGGGAGSMPQPGSGPMRSLLRPPAVPAGATGGAPSGGGGGEGAAGELQLPSHPPFEAFLSVAALVSYCGKLSVATVENSARLEELCGVKDARFDEVKRHLAAAEAAVRVRDEDVQNQRYVLKYLVDTTAALREDLQRARQASALSTSAVALSPYSVGGGGGSDGLGSGLSGAGSRRPRPRVSMSGMSASSVLAGVGNLSPIASPPGSPDDSPNSIASAQSLPGGLWRRSRERREDTVGGAHGGGGSDKHSRQRTSSFNHALIAGGGGGTEAGQDDTPVPVVAARLDLDAEIVSPVLVSPPTPAAGAPAGVRTAPPGPTHGERKRGVVAPPEPQDDLVLDDDEEGEEGEEGGADQLGASLEEYQGGGEEEEEEGQDPFHLDHPRERGGSTNPVAGTQPPPSGGVSPSPPNPPRLLPLTSTSLGKPPRPPSKGLPVAATLAPVHHEFDDGEGGGGGEDEVERIIAHRVVAGPASVPRMLYKVRWKGASPGEDEWFPREDLVADFPAQVAAYEQSLRASAF